MVRVLTLILAGGFLSLPTARGDVSPQLKQLQGSWSVIAVSAAGKDESKVIEDQDRFVFAGDQVTMHNGNRAPQFTARIVAVEVKGAQGLDLSVQDGDKLVTLPCLFKQSGERMRLAIQFVPGSPRPTSFETTEDSRFGSFLLQRLKPGQKSDRQLLLEAEKAAETLTNQRRLPEATQQLENAARLARELNGPLSARSGALADQLAKAYEQQGQMTKVEPLFEESLAAAEKSLGPKHRVVGLIADRLAKVAQSLGHYERAETLFKRALEISEADEGKDSVDTAASINQLALFYQATGKFDQAEELYQRALKIFSDRYGADDPRTMTAYSNLGVLYRVKGEPYKAEPIFSRAIEILEEYEKDQPNLARVLNNQAMVYWMMGKQELAVRYMRRCQFILEDEYGENHPDVATVLNNMAMVLVELGEQEEAERNLVRSVTIYDQAFGENSVMSARPLSNLSAIYIRKGDFDQALAVVRRSATILEAQFGTEHPDLGYALNQIGILQLAMQDYRGAEVSLKTSLKIWEAKLGDASETAQCLSNLALLYSTDGRWSDAVQASNRARHILRRYVRNVLPTLSESEQLEFLEKRVRPEYHKAISLALARPDDVRLIELSAEWVLNGSALTQETLAQSMLLARRSNLPAQHSRLQELVAVRKRLANLSLAGAAGDDQQLAETRLALTQNEQALAKQITLAAGDASQRDPWVHLADVRKRLPAGTVLVQFARFEVFKPDLRQWEETSTFHYAAWIVPPAGPRKVQFVNLGPAEVIDRAADAAQAAIAATTQKIDRVGEARATAELNKPLSDLAALTLGPLRQAVDGYDHWMLSPDASLWLVPWCALPLATDTYVIEKHTLSYLVSGRDLVTPIERVAAEAPLVLADPNYNLIVDASAKPASSSAPTVAQRPARQSAWTALAGTAKEAKAISPLLARYVSQPPRVYTGDGATEAQFKKAIHPRVLVLSTHGFFEPDVIRPKSAPGLLRGMTIEAPQLPQPAVAPSGAKADAGPQNPLLRCGLVLAGANRAQVGDDDSEDGTLFGLEIIGCDLRGTDLVVLSACETGLGRVRNGEGVAGLRQAFQLAGASAVVSTLWQIPDDATSQLMVDFFTQLVAKDSKAQALAAAQRKAIAARRKSQGAAHPFYWAAFTLTGAPR